MAGEQIELGARLFVSQDDLNPSILQLIQALIGANAQLGQFANTLGQTSSTAQQTASGVNVAAQGISAVGAGAQQAAQAAANAAQIYQNAAGRWINANGQFANAAQIQQHLAQQAAAAGQAAQSAAQGVGALGAAAQGAAGGLGAASTAAAGTAVNIANLNINIRQAGQSAGQAQTAFVSLGGVLSGLPGPLGQAAQLFGHLTVQIQQNQAMALGLAAVYTGIGAGIASGLGEAVREAAEFQRTFQDVEVVSRATAEQMTQFKETAIALGASSQFSSQQIAQGFYELTSAGLNVREALGAIEPAVIAATLGHTQLKETTIELASIMRQFGLGAEDVTRIVDVQTQMVGQSLLHWNQMGEAFRNVQGTAKFMGISLESTAAALEIMANAGTTATMAGTSFRTFLDRLVKGEGSTDEAGRAIAKLNLNLWDANGAFIGLVPILRQVETATTGMTDRQKDGIIAMLGGARAGALLRDTLNAVKEVEIDGQTVMLRGVDVLKYYEEQNYAAAGSAQRANDIIKTGFNLNLQILTASVQEAGIRIGTVLLPAMTELVKVGAQVINVFVQAPESVQRIVTIFATAAAAGALLVGVLTTLGIAAPIVATGFAAASVALAAVGISAGALVPIIVGVAAASTALAVAWEHDWLNIQETTHSTIDAMGGWFKDLAADADLLGKAMQGIVLPNLGNLFSGLGDAVHGSPLGGIADAIGAAVGPQLQAVGNALGQQLGHAIIDGANSVLLHTVFAPLGLLQDVKTVIESNRDTIQQAWFNTLSPDQQQAELDKQAIATTDSMVAGILSKVKDGEGVLSSAMFELRAQMVKEGIPNNEIADTWDQRFQDLLTRIKAYRPDLFKEGEGTAVAVADGMRAHKQTVEEAAASLMEGAKGNLHKAALEAADAGQQMTAQYLFQQEAIKHLIDSALTPLDAAQKAEIATMSAKEGYLRTANFLLQSGLITYKEYQSAIAGVTTAHKEQANAANTAAGAEKALKQEMTPGQQVYERHAQTLVGQISGAVPINVQSQLADFGKGQSYQDQLRKIVDASGVGKQVDLTTLYYGTPQQVSDRIALLAAALTGGAAAKLVPAATQTTHNVVQAAATGIQDATPAAQATAAKAGTDISSAFTNTFSQGLSTEQTKTLLNQFMQDLADGLDFEEVKRRYQERLQAALTPDPATLEGAATGTEEVYGQALAQAFNDDIPGTIETVKGKIRELLGSDPAAEARATQFGEDITNAFRNGLTADSIGPDVQRYLDRIATEIPTAAAPAVTAADVAGQGIRAALSAQLDSEKAHAIADSFGQALATQMTGQPQIITTAVSGVLNAALDTALIIGVVATQIHDLGVSIVSGIARGITEGLPTLVSTVQSAAQAAIDAAKGVIRPGSPSRTMAEEVGLPMIQGIGAGFIEGLGSVQGIISNSVSSLVTGASGELGRGMGQLVKDVDDQVGVEIKKVDPTVGFSPLNLPGQGTVDEHITSSFSAYMENWTEKLLNSLEVTSYDTSKGGTNMAPIGIRSNAKYKGPTGTMGPINFNYPGDYAGAENDSPATWDPYNQGPATPQDDLIAFSPGMRGSLGRATGGFDLQGTLDSLAGSAQTLADVAQQGATGISPMGSQNYGTGDAAVGIGRSGGRNVVTTVDPKTGISTSVDTTTTATGGGAGLAPYRAPSGFSIDAARQWMLSRGEDPSALVAQMVQEIVSSVTTRVSPNGSLISQEAGATTIRNRPETEQEIVNRLQPSSGRYMPYGPQLPGSTGMAASGATSDLAALGVGTGGGYGPTIPPGMTQAGSSPYWGEFTAQRDQPGGNRDWNSWIAGRSAALQSYGVQIPPTPPGQTVATNPYNQVSYPPGTFEPTPPVVRPGTLSQDLDVALVDRIVQAIQETGGAVGGQIIGGRYLPPSGRLAPGSMPFSGSVAPQDVYGELISRLQTQPRVAGTDEEQRAYAQSLADNIEAQRAQRQAMIDASAQTRQWIQDQRDASTSTDDLYQRLSLEASQLATPPRTSGDGLLPGMSEQLASDLASSMGYLQARQDQFVQRGDQTPMYSQAFWDWQNNTESGRAALQAQYPQIGPVGYGGGPVPDIMRGPNGQLQYVFPENAINSTDIGTRAGDATARYFMGLGLRGEPNFQTADAINRSYIQMGQEEHDWQIRNLPQPVPVPYGSTTGEAYGSAPGTPGRGGTYDTGTAQYSPYGSSSYGRAWYGAAGYGGGQAANTGYMPGRPSDLQLYLNDQLAQRDSGDRAYQEAGGRRTPGLSVVDIANGASYLSTAAASIRRVGDSADTFGSRLDNLGMGFDRQAENGRRLMDAQGQYIDQFGQLRSTLVNVTDSLGAIATSAGVLDTSFQSASDIFAGEGGPGLSSGLGDKFFNMPSGLLPGNVNPSDFYSPSGFGGGFNPNQPINGPVSYATASRLESILGSFNAAGVNPMPASLAQINWMSSIGGVQTYNPNLLLQMGMGAVGGQPPSAGQLQLQQKYGIQPGAVSIQSFNDLVSQIYMKNNPNSGLAVNAAGQSVSDFFTAIQQRNTPNISGQGIGTSGSGLASVPLYAATGNGLIDPSMPTREGASAMQKAQTDLTLQTNEMVSTAKLLAQNLSFASAAWSSISDLSKSMQTTVSTLPGIFTAFNVSLTDANDAMRKVSSIAGSWTLPTLGGPSGPNPTGGAPVQGYANGNTAGGTAFGLTQQAADQIVAANGGVVPPDFQQQLVRMLQGNKQYTDVVGHTTETTADLQQKQRELADRVFALQSEASALGTAYAQGIGVMDQLNAAQAALAAAAGAMAGSVGTPPPLSVTNPGYVDPTSQGQPVPEKPPPGAPPGHWIVGSYGQGWQWLPDSSATVPVPTTISQSISSVPIPTNQTTTTPTTNSTATNSTPTGPVLIARTATQDVYRMPDGSIKRVPSGSPAPGVTATTTTPPTGIYPGFPPVQTPVTPPEVQYVAAGAPIAATDIKIKPGFQVGPAHNTLAELGGFRGASSSTVNIGDVNVSMNVTTPSAGADPLVVAKVGKAIREEMRRQGAYMGRTPD